MLINLSIPGCEGLVCELQLHFTKIHDLKEIAHRTYDVRRAAGFDRPEYKRLRREALMRKGKARIAAAKEKEDKIKQAAAKRRQASGARNNSSN